MSEPNYVAVVERIFPDGPRGAYAVARSENLGSITFSLEETWQEKDWPEPGTVVMLFDIRKRRAGWRAESGRFVRPSDEQEMRTSPAGARKTTSKEEQA